VLPSGEGGGRNGELDSASAGFEGKAVSESSARARFSVQTKACTCFRSGRSDFISMETFSEKGFPKERGETRLHQVRVGEEEATVRI